jgi:hypothetical protein
MSKPRGLPAGSKNKNTTLDLSQKARDLRRERGGRGNGWLYSGGRRPCGGVDHVSGFDGIAN